MNDKQAEAVLALMTGQIWPNAYLERPIVKRWLQYLPRYSSDDAIEALKVMELTTSFFPKIAEFEDVIKPIVKRRRDEEREERAALEAGPQDRLISPEKQKEALAKVREMIAESGGIGNGSSGKHNHPGKTPNQCPECRKRWNLPEPGSTDLPACPNCEGLTVEAAAPVDDLRYYCVDCNLLYNGSWEEREAYRKGTAQPRRPHRKEKAKK